MLSSRQPTLWQAAVSTLGHLAEKDTVVMIDEHIEENLFSMLDMETDSKIGKHVCATIDQLFDATCPSHPSHWLQICCNVILATSKNGAGIGYIEPETGISSVSFGKDVEDMIVNSKKVGRLASNAYYINKANKGDQLSQYWTRVFAAECLSRLPIAFGAKPTHFDLAQARKWQMTNVIQTSGGDWLVLHLAQLVALAYQISMGSVEKMQSLGIILLSNFVDKFGRTANPELPEHFLMWYQAQLASVVQTALGTSAHLLLLDASLQLATKVLTRSITSGDRAIFQYMFALISCPDLQNGLDTRLKSDCWKLMQLAKPMHIIS